MSFEFGLECNANCVPLVAYDNKQTRRALIIIANLYKNLKRRKEEEERQQQQQNIKPDPEKENKTKGAR